MPVNITPLCTVCNKPIHYLVDDAPHTCSVCGAAFEGDATCPDGHFVCPLCRQKAARRAIIDHCLASAQAQPYPLVLSLMALPQVLMHGPEHHLLLTAALLTAYCNQTGQQARLPGLLAEADARSLEVPGGACGFWGVCGAAIGSGIFMSIVTEASPFATEAWGQSGQLAARCAAAVSGRGGPRCCKRDSFLSLLEAIPHSNAALGTHFEAPETIRCQYYPNNSECKGCACPFFPAG